MVPGKGSGQQPKYETFRVALKPSTSHSILSFNSCVSPKNHQTTILIHMHSNTNVPIRYQLCSQRFVSYISFLSDNYYVLTTKGTICRYADIQIQIIKIIQIIANLTNQ